VSTPDFCERLPQIARVYGRQTKRAAEIVRLIGYVADGLPRQRLLVGLAIVTSDDTVLRRMREQPSGQYRLPPFATWGSTIWLGTKGKLTAPSWWILTYTASSTCSRSEPLRASPPGSSGTRKS
jgi:hypothetical protein